ncbi:MAG: antibiotic biosynthesis monooxygenase [Ktedonobacteraceae bacterium]|nr:antibiotic biosynthesis monooxygenase [Ktedonobacteraceae bacterium]
MTVRVMVFTSIIPGQQAAFEAAFTEVTRQVKGTPGHIKDELLHQENAPESYILLSEWESREAFIAWEDAPIHRQITTPMRPYWSGRVERKIYDVAVRLNSQTVEPLVREVA